MKSVDQAARDARMDARIADIKRGMTVAKAEYIGPARRAAQIPTYEYTPPQDFTRVEVYLDRSSLTLGADASVELLCGEQLLAAVTLRGHEKLTGMMPLMNVTGFKGKAGDLLQLKVAGMDEPDAVIRTS